jgi:hypothetical protein
MAFLKLQVLFYGDQKYLEVHPSQVSIDWTVFFYIKHVLNISDTNMAAKKYLRLLTFCGRLSGQPRHSSVVKQVDCRGSPAKCFILASRREWQFPAI